MSKNTSIIINNLLNILNNLQISNEVREELMTAMHLLSWDVYKIFTIKIQCNGCGWNDVIDVDRIPLKCPKCNHFANYIISLAFPTMVDADGNLDDDGLWKYRNYKIKDEEKWVKI